MDVLIAQVTTEINKLAYKKRQFEGNSLDTKTTIRAKVKPIIEEMNTLRIQLMEYQRVRDEKIPDHEKLPKDCIFYKHFLQVEANTRIEKAAKDQMKEDRETLLEIAEGLSPKKKKEEGAPCEKVPELNIKPVNK